MLFHIIRLLFITYFFWNIIPILLKHDSPELGIIDYLYIKVSRICRVLADQRTITKENVEEIMQTVKLVHLSNGLVVGYPINGYTVTKDNGFIKWFLIKTLCLRNATPLASNENMLTWYPINKEMVLKNCDTSWAQNAQINGSLVQSINVSSTAEKSLLQLVEDDQDFELENDNVTSFPLQESLKTVENDINNWYLIDDLLIRFDDDSVFWFPTGKRKENQTILYKWYPFKETSKYWYAVNKTHIAVKWPDINVTRQTKLIIHGFHATPYHRTTYDLAKAYYDMDKFNVILLDATQILRKIYFRCVRDAQIMGRAIADLFIHLERFGARAEDFHLLGVSLGAHIAGWAGKYHRYRTGQKIGRITGLDPAGPCYAYVDSSERLDQSDALYVDVIHTNAMVQGISESLGHADFYLNGGGPGQPGCTLSVCSHLRAAHVFTSSVSEPKLFVGVKCGSWWHFMNNHCKNETAILGHESNSLTRGNFYLRTSGEFPYGLGINGSKPEYRDPQNF